MPSATPARRSPSPPWSCSASSASWARGWLASGTRSPSSKGCWAGSPTGCGTPAGAALTLSRVEEHCVPEGLGPSDIEVRRVGPVIRSPARLAVRFPFRAHICGLVPASDVNWLAAASWWHGEGALKDSPLRCRLGLTPSEGIIVRGESPGSSRAAALVRGRTSVHRHWRRARLLPQHDPEPAGLPSALVMGINGGSERWSGPWCCR
jgi:hypothetical protein